MSRVYYKEAVSAIVIYDAKITLSSILIANRLVASIIGFDPCDSI
jgi:hypothetical protein